ncbi:hypothetical protein KUCAC02_001637, partial [Chaenocephalus aceratus]
PLTTAADPPVCVLFDGPMIGVIDTQGTQVIHTSSKDIHRSTSISSDRRACFSTKRVGQFPGRKQPVQTAQPHTEHRQRRSCK